MSEKAPREDLVGKTNQQGKNKNLIQLLITGYVVVLLLVWFFSQSTDQFRVVLGGPFFALVFLSQFYFLGDIPYIDLALPVLAIIFYTLVMFFITKANYSRWPISVHLVFHAACLAMWLLLGGFSLVVAFPTV
ncbi:MAG: hypothetical protein MPJ24_05035 [Pirellulaceae bacterium]|nr:hypothetical protein [Pirellulaceae bacterium]